MHDITLTPPGTVPGDGISRRRLIAGLGAASGAAGLLAALPGGTIVAGPAAPAVGAAPARFPEVLAPVVPSLTYVSFDAYAFFNEDTGQGRDIASISGNTAVGTYHLVAPLQVPLGSRIRQVNVSYFGQTSIAIYRRSLAAPLSDQVAFLSDPLPEHTGMTPEAQSLAMDVPLVDGFAYTLRLFGPPGHSIFAATVGYQAPTQGFVPVDPPVRPLDTRQPGPQQGKLQPGEERVVDLSAALPAGARGAVLNLTITGTETSFGYVSVYRNGIAWPGNSSINWSTPELTAANAVITAVDDDGRIIIRGGEAATHVVIDVVGALV